MECLQALQSRFPKIRQWLFDKQGSLRPQVQLFVNGQKIYADELNKPLKDEDELLILFAIGGG